ncbi:TlpA family protein disulfide reductase [Kaistella flava (ex Peng et al. 2021)]|uniref:TlpA family protein disulfide reductase n=1 Tax=Kaistella flava (ex Peng et al. 2021) TaxID=2038776 RepID=A0A7M2Y5Q3_9FLAO|nr:TlpA disulfide reductase family protein [Kaistella flava (ex Peng et al. 2021)]QOW08984.1 TlpA family protein disulfide reductase [Kaistella flava (ex Peng et al. 2021)]
MRKIVFGLAMMCCVSFNAQSIENIKVKNIKGENIALKDLNNDKPLVLSFWATWCLPCMEELNAVNDNLEEWKKERDFDFIAVSTDDPRTVNKVKTVVNGKNWNFDQVLLDPSQSIKRSLNVNNVPTTLVYFKNKLVYSHVGYAPGDEEELFNKLKQIQ